MYILNIKKIFQRFWAGKIANSGNPFVSRSEIADGFTEEQKAAIVNSALTTASQILITATVMTNAQNFITGDCVLPDGTKWRLKFERIESEKD